MLGPCQRVYTGHVAQASVRLTYADHVLHVLLTLQYRDTTAVPVTLTVYITSPLQPLTSRTHWFSTGTPQLLVRVRARGL